METEFNKTVPEKVFYFDGAWGINTGKLQLLVRTTRMMTIKVFPEMNDFEVYQVLKGFVSQIEDESWQVLSQSSNFKESKKTREQCSWTYQTIVPLKL